MAFVVVLRLYIDMYTYVGVGHCGSINSVFGDYSEWRRGTLPLSLTKGLCGVRKSGLFTFYPRVCIASMCAICHTLHEWSRVNRPFMDPFYKGH